MVVIEPETRPSSLPGTSSQRLKKLINAKNLLRRRQQQEGSQNNNEKQGPIIKSSALLLHQMMSKTAVPPPSSSNQQPNRFKITPPTAAIQAFLDSDLANDDDENEEGEERKARRPSSRHRSLSVLDFSAVNTTATTTTGNKNQRPKSSRGNSRRSVSANAGTRRRRHRTLLNAAAPIAASTSSLQVHDPEEDGFLAITQDSTPTFCIKIRTDNPQLLNTCPSYSKLQSDNWVTVVEDDEDFGGGVVGKIKSAAAGGGGAQQSYTPRKSYSAVVDTKASVTWSSAFAPAANDSTTNTTAGDDFESLPMQEAQDPTNWFDNASSRHNVLPLEEERIDDDDDDRGVIEDDILEEDFTTSLGQDFLGLFAA